MVGPLANKTGSQISTRVMLQATLTNFIVYDNNKALEPGLGIRSSLIVLDQAKQMV